MISAFFIFNQKGEVLISRLYRTDFKRSIADVFRIQVVSNSDVRSPIITLGSTSFFHVRINNLYVVAVTKNNANAALVFEFCYRFINICKSYFGKIDEESIKNNFVLIYELIDEINDFGFPQNSEIDTLKSYITTESVVSSAQAAEESSKITAQATGATSWRRTDVKYKKNEAFVDVVEVVNLSMSAKGNILRADVDGHIQMRAYLTGTPECKFGLNDKLVIDKNDRGAAGGDAVELDDCRFHQCVRLTEFDTDRSISFIPPDGEFELMRYRATSNVKLPLRVIPTVAEIGTSKVSYDVTVKTNFSPKLSATNVILRIPTPLNTTSVDCTVANGKAKYVPGENVVVWKIPRLQGGQECSFSGVAELTSTTSRQVWARPPIDIDFQVLMFTSSGLIVRFLKVFEKSNYTSVKWVRYLTKASGSYQVRAILRCLVAAIDRRSYMIVYSPKQVILLTVMFWRFGFHSASSIDSLLDKDDVSLEAILDQDDLLQECKAQNTRLIDYFSRVDVLQRLLAYVTEQIEIEDKGQFKYPYAATEVLCCEIWSIVETCVNEPDQLLVPFWESILDRSPEEIKLQLLMASRWAKVNAFFMNKKPAEMLTFIQSQPALVERMLRHIENPPFVDLLVRIIQMDELSGDINVLEWLSSQDLMPRLIDLLSSMNPPDIHQVAGDLIKTIIGLATPSPNAADLHIGPPSNRFARELAHRDSVMKLTGYMLQDFGPNRNVVPDSSEGDGPQLYPTFESATSSVVQSMSVLTELIRKNNSDYFEPYLFHTLRNRLIQVQQHLQPGDDPREMLERAMNMMVDRMGVVRLGSILEVMCENLDTFLGFLTQPRSAEGPAATTVGAVVPLTFERLRICELLAELLHCSNMALLNRPPEFNSLYDSEGRLQGGLSGLEELAQLLALNNADHQDRMDEGGDDADSVHQLPISRHTSHDSTSLDSDEDMSDDDDAEPGSSDDEAMEEVVMYDEPQSLEITISPSLPPDSPASIADSPTAADIAQPTRSSSLGAVSDHGSVHSKRRLGRTSTRESAVSDTPRLPTPGDKMKSAIIRFNVFAGLLDLFAQYPWNNFLHTAVYDLVHQLLTGQVENPLSRELLISLFKDAKLMHRILEMSNLNDIESAKPKGVRLGYMGHITMISTDLIAALERFPADIVSEIRSYAPEEPAWTNYVNGKFQETKHRDTSLLGGGKPVVGPGLNRPGLGRWKVDEEVPSPSLSPSINGGERNPVNGAGNGSGTPVPNGSGSSMRGEFRRTGVRREGSADFGVASMDDDDDLGPSSNFAFDDMHTDNNGFGGTDSDDEEEGGWLARSTFHLSNPPLKQRISLSAGFDDAFDPSDSPPRRPIDDPFSSEDDGFGPFSEASGSTEPFTFSSSFSDEDSGFDNNFGDFGEFQTAIGGNAGSPLADGELTPTAGSWTFASGSTGSIEDLDVDAAFATTPTKEELALQSAQEPPDTKNTAEKGKN